MTNSPLIQSAIRISISVAVIWVILLVLSLSLHTTVRGPTTTERFNLSSDQFSELLKQTRKESDSDAACRIAFYYKAFKKSPDQAQRWFRIAAKLGSKEARDFLAE